MQVNQTLNEGLKKGYKVTIPANDLQVKINSKLEDIAQNVKIDGFRPGKVPADIVKQRYGQSIMGEVLEDTVKNSIADLYAQEKLQPAMEPKIEVEKFEEGKDVEYSIELEVLPEVSDVDFSQISLERIAIDISEGDIDEAIGRIQKDFKDFAPVEGDNIKAENGHTVVLDFEGKLEGTPFDGGTAKGHRLELGSGAFIPGFEEKLVGIKTGESRSLDITFPEAYHAEDLAGKDVVFDVTVHEILEAKELGASDELAQKVGLKDLAELKELITKELNEDYSQFTRARAKKALFDELEKILTFDIPQSMVEREFEILWKDALTEKEKNPNFFDKPEDEMKKEYRAVSERRVRLGILLSDIGSKEKMEVSQQELQKAMIKEARLFPGQEQKIMEYYMQHPEAIEHLKGPILEEKVVDFILEKVKTEEKRMSSKDWWDLVKSEEEAEQDPKKKSKKKAS